jgi:hypothetical protein
MVMRPLPRAAALLIALVTACEPEGTGAPSAPEAATEVAVMPEPSVEAPGGQATPTSAAAQADLTTCSADKLDRWLNALPSEEVKEEIAAAAGKRPIRYFTQGDAITMDYSEARLNVELGDDGRIRLFRCG